MLKLRILNDLHTEFKSLTLSETFDELNTILILSGDIGLATKPDTWLTFIKPLTDRFKYIIYVPGNHEHYKGVFNTTVKKINEGLRKAKIKNCKCIDRGVLRFDKYSFLGATLWTDFNNGNPLIMNEARYKMADYRVITYVNHLGNYHKFTPEISYAEHIKSKKWLFKHIELEKDAGQKVVVVTHHAPSFKSIEDKYANDLLNYAYASNLDQLIINTQPDIWCHGHTHTVFDYNINNSRIICNSRGYTPAEHTEFNERLTIQI